jgi:ABC-type proline/glycine betaine transport system permease subunit
MKLVRGFCYKRRKSIGKVQEAQPIPATVDYNLWSGPAPMAPLMRKSLHYDWHWAWLTDNGDIGNQGIHEMDMCRWAAGQAGLPPRVACLGGRFGYVDDGETPNTQLAYFDYQPVPILFEVRGLPMAREEEGESMDNFKGVRVGVVIECEDGYFAGGAGGGSVFDRNGKKIKQFAGIFAHSAAVNRLSVARFFLFGSMYSVDDLGNGEYLDLKNLILPAITLGIRPLAVIVELTRSSMLDVMSQDYIRTAKAKGLTTYKIITRHALKNAMNPVITAVSGWLASLMAGAVFVEYVFDWKGVGVIIVDALEKYDFPVVMGVLLFISIILVIINIFVDILYGLLDPRIRVT